MIPERKANRSHPASAESPELQSSVRVAEVAKGQTILIRQGFQYVLRLKAQQESLLRRWVGCRRFVFNEALAFQRAELAAGRPRPGFGELCARLLELKKVHPWLAEPPMQSLQQAIKDLCAAWHWTETSRFGEPRFKKRGEGDTVRLPQGCKYDARAGTVKLPKLGVVRLRHSREAEGLLKNVTLRQVRGRWIAALQTERPHSVPVPASSHAVGLDFGAATTIMPSAGEPIKLPPSIARYERRARRLQQALSRKIKSSQNHAKARERLADCYARIAAIRKDFLHKTTTGIVAKHELIAIEDLNVQRMTASAAGTVEAPGRNAKAKSGLNRAILRNGWSMARRMLEYKAAWAGSTLVAVPPEYTSQQCSVCGFTNAGNRREQARFACLACGHSEHADRNAARNVLARAERRIADTKQASPSRGSARTAGHAGTHACETSAMRGSRPRPAAQDGLIASSIGPSLAGIEPELGRSGKLWP